MNQFRIHRPYEPQGDQPRAIEELVRGLKRGDEHQVLLGVTGSGKTFTIANVIAEIGLPTLVLSHNKTLAAQLYGEFKGFFPENGVGYFISYYDYYQPEAYVPATNTYIEKDASINDDIDRMRLSSTAMLLERPDVVIVASVSSIYGLGSPSEFKGLMLDVSKGGKLDRDRLLSRLIEIQYSRNEFEFARGTFRVRGEVVEIRPAYEEHAVRLEFDDDVVSRISIVDPLTGDVIRRQDRLALYPAKHFVLSRGKIDPALKSIKQELAERLAELEGQGKLLEAQRLRNRTEYDLEILKAIGYCPGIENYSRHLSHREPGERPECLLDYFPRPFLLVIDESHVTVSQVGAMYEGDRSRKQTLIDYGFRLPSALDNRPLKFSEFEQLVGPTIYVSATPADFEINKTGGVVVEQLIRPTGLVDPVVQVRPITGQVDDLLGEIRQRAARNERVLVTTLTKRMAEDLTDYLHEMGVKVRYLHSDIDALERVELLRGLRLAEFDVLVGINLLREGLDLPEVSLVAILDADKEGFLRSERSLIQTAGRAARHVGGDVILYADRMTGSMARALSETGRRREAQLAYNREHGITPKSIQKSVEDVMRITAVADARYDEEEDRARARVAGAIGASPDQIAHAMERGDTIEMMAQLEREMLAAARALEFERAASLRDRLEELASQALMAGAIGQDEAARAIGEQRAGVRPGATRTGAPIPPPRPTGRSKRLADGRPAGAAASDAGLARGEKGGPDVVPGEDPVRRAQRRPKSMVPPRLKRKSALNLEHVARPLVALALAEDLGSGDVTTLACIDLELGAQAVLLAKQDGVLAGLDVARLAFELIDHAVRFDALLADGDPLAPGTVVARLTGSARSLLSAERVALNFVQRLSGIATLTHRYVQRLEGTGTRVLDTRKTTPGLRPLEKYAVSVGGGHNHRHGLYDMYLVKDNHIRAAGSLTLAVGHIAAVRDPHLLLEVEAASLDLVREALGLDVDRILLDNMPLADVAQAVARIDAAGAPARPSPRRPVGARRWPEIEVSGGMRLDTVRPVADLGVDYVSVGALTHSAPALDLALDFGELG